MNDDSVEEPERTVEPWRGAARLLEMWIRERDYAGYDPHDVLSSGPVRALTFGSRWVAVAWTQLGKRSPVRLRPALGVRPHRNAKAIGLALSSYARLDAATDHAHYRGLSAQLVAWLRGNANPGVPGLGWGYPFPWAHRDGFVPAGTPSSVVTAFVGQGLLDAEEWLGLDEAGRLAAGCAEFLLRGLNRITGPAGTFCFSYTGIDRRSVHNANLLAAALLARLAARFGHDEAAAAAVQAARYTAIAQRPDGSWPYGPGARSGWVDSFHTGYSLAALHEIRTFLDVSEFDETLERGIAFWRRAFFTGPAVGYYPNRAFPIDVHAVAHAIVALHALRSRIPDARAEAERLGHWCLREMRASDGSFYYMKRRLWKSRSAHMRWVQAWMLRALADLVAGAAPPPRPASNHPFAAMCEKGDEGEPGRCGEIRINAPEMRFPRAQKPLLRLHRAWL